MAVGCQTQIQQLLLVQSEIQHHRQGAVGLLPHQAVNGIQSGTVWRLVQYGQNSFHSAATAEQNKECYEKQFAHVGVQTYIKKRFFCFLEGKNSENALKESRKCIFILLIYNKL